MRRAAGSSGPRRVNNRPLLGILALVAVIAVVAVVLWRPGVKPFTHADLLADPAFALRLPASDQLLEVGSDASSGIDGSVAAFAGHIFGAAATSADVYVFYERELARLGWLVEPPPYARATTETDIRLYCKVGVIFRLAIDDKAKAFAPSVYKGKDYVTVFDATLVANDPSFPCPRPPVTGQP
jgi:hypothetical protein